MSTDATAESTYRASETPSNHSNPANPSILAPQAAARGPKVNRNKKNRGAGLADLKGATANCRKTGVCMFQLMYVSTASWTMSNDDLCAILDVSRAYNRRLGITGILLHLDRGFLQILEGPKDAVMEIFSKIERDHRHTGVRVLLQDEVPQRLFGDWTMGFDRWTKDAPRTAGMFQITQDAINGAIEPEKAAVLAILLRNFYRVNAGQRAA
jgi:hypothetical protein